MSLSDRRVFLFSLGALALSGCGYEPVYGTGGAAAGLKNRVTVKQVNSSLGYVFAGRMEERLGTPSDPAYQLSYALRTRKAGLAVTKSQSTTRFNIIGSADYTLRNLATGATVASGTVSNQTGYSASSTTVTTLAAERDANERLMIILADQVMTRLIAQAERSGL